MADKEVRFNLESRVLQFIRQHNLAPGGRKVLVAVSGGPDSVCLLHLLAKNVPGIELRIAHLDHQLRGADSSSDARYVSELARSLGIPATVAQRDVRAYQAEHRISLEEAAREVRYAFLAQVARETGCDRVAVGHTRDDHIETVLMHIIRGSGTRGLIGLKPETAWQTVQGTIRVIRPLLEISKAETAQYCAEHRLEPRMDSSNLSPSLFRNRIRQELLPLLQSYNPQISEALVRISRVAGDETGYLDGQTALLWDTIAQEEGDTIVLKKKLLRELHPVLQRNIFRVALEKLLGNLKDIEMRHIEEIMAALGKPAGKQIDLPFGVVFLVEYDRYLLTKYSAPVSHLPQLEGEFPLIIPGETVFPGWRAQATIIEEKPLIPAEDSYTAYCDMDKTGNGLLVRKRQQGDRFQPLGMDGQKKLSDFMIDARIPQAQRDGVPLVCAGDRIIWVVGYRIDERVKVTGTTRRVLQLRFERC